MTLFRFPFWGAAAKTFRVVAAARQDTELGTVIEAVCVTAEGVIVTEFVVVTVYISRLIDSVTKARILKVKAYGISRDGRSYGDSRGGVRHTVWYQDSRGCCSCCCGTAPISNYPLTSWAQAFVHCSCIDAKEASTEGVGSRDSTQTRDHIVEHGADIKAHHRGCGGCVGQSEEGGESDGDHRETRG